MKSRCFSGNAICWSILLIVIFSNARAAVSEDPAYWIEKMGTALTKQNYQGVYTYMRGRNFDSVRVTHQYRDGEERERFFYLNGEPREMIRENDALVCYHPEQNPHQLDHETSIGPFTRVFNDYLAAGKDLYHFSFHGKGRIADRSAIRLAITPVGSDRYGYRLWLDEETGLLLQSHLLDRRRVLEIFQFVDIRIGDMESLEKFEQPSGGYSHVVSSPASSIADSAARSDKTDKLTSETSNDPGEETAGPETLGGMDTRDQTEVAPERVFVKLPAWQANWLPKGFQPVSTEGNSVVFTDGVTSLSVFVEESEHSESPELVTYSGGTVVFSRQRQWRNGHL
ncbi:MAG: MucB/RseB C-terminal domain-containing protein, partial [Gammaproteobacteria bacterium]|nr:MucB/RseB C-terminal domain-containing protein [Gammaproteobacteria bacterium]